MNIRKYISKDKTMSKEIRKQINKIKDFGKLLNENLETNKMNAKEIINILNNKGIKVSKKRTYYNGSGYREKYTISDSDEVDGKTPYMGIPAKVKSQGFITKNGILQNFFYHNGNEFETTTNIDEFLNWITNK